MKIHLSDAIGSERVPFTPQSSYLLGQAHYSWKIISEMYREGLRKSHFNAVKIVAPDIYQSASARKIANISDKDIHLAVKPSEFIRPMFGVRNFFVCGWEFPQFMSSHTDDGEGHNQIALFNRADTVLCWSEFTARNLRGYGVSRAMALPPPVVDLMPSNSEAVDHVQCLHYCPEGADHVAQFALSSIKDRYETVFISVLNPWDARKNVKNLIEAFNQFEQLSKKSAALVIKLIVDNRGTTANNFPEILRERYGISDISENMFFFGDMLTNKQMMACYEMSDFYISASSAEGLNLPLIESMACGVVPISSTATAMADYILPNNAIVLPASPAPAGADFSSIGDAIELVHFPPSVGSLAKAFDEATALSPKQRNTKVRNAKAQVADRYGLKRFRDDFAAVVGG